MYFRNTQPWGIQLFPRVLSLEVIDALSGNSCHRVEFIVPSCDPAMRDRYGLTFSDDQLRLLILQLEERNISAQVIYWIQGPDEKEGEADRVSRHIVTLGYPKFALHPFPLHHDSRLFQDVVDRGGTPPPITEWIAWAQKPEVTHPPVALWEGVSGLNRCRSTMQSIQRKVMRNPSRHIHRLTRHLHLSSHLARIKQDISNWRSRMIRK